MKTSLTSKGSELQSTVSISQSEWITQFIFCGKRQDKIVIWELTNCGFECNYPGITCLPLPQWCKSRSELYKFKTMNRTTASIIMSVKMHKNRNKRKEKILFQKWLTEKYKIKIRKKELSLGRFEPWTSRIQVQSPIHCSIETWTQGELELS